MDVDRKKETSYYGCPYLKIKKLEESFQIVFLILAVTWLVGVLSFNFKISFGLSTQDI